jgi:hypothetical protein
MVQGREFSTRLGCGVTRSVRKARGSPLVPKGLHVSSSIFDPGLTEVDQARTGATQALRPYGSEQWLAGRRSREERLSFSIQSSLTCGLQRFDDAEACDRDSPAEPAGKENGTRRDLGRPSLTRRSMNRGEWLRGLSRRAESISAQLANGPVGGAPSRSGFLATPTDASPRQTFSALLSITGEEMLGNRQTSPLDASSRPSKCRGPSRYDSGDGRIENPSRSGLDSAARTCCRQSPPGSEAVRLRRKLERAGNAEQHHRLYTRRARPVT